MLTVCWSLKGGSGTTLVAAVLAARSPRRHLPVLVVDLAGDIAPTLGLADPTGSGVHDWVATSSTPPEAIQAIAVTATDDLRLAHPGTARAPLQHPRWDVLGDYLADLDTHVIVDAGLHPPPALIEVADQNLLVVRPCYLTLRRASPMPFRPSGVVVIGEPGRALRDNDIAAAVLAPVVASIPYDPAIGRISDAGLLTQARLPRSLRQLHALAS